MLQYVISVRDLRAVVSRRVDLGPNSWSYEPAENWEDLEDDAIDEVEAFGGAINMSALYPCSWSLAERAEWLTLEEVLEPIWLCDGKILDGRNRYRAWQRCGNH